MGWMGGDDLEQEKDGRQRGEKSLKPCEWWHVVIHFVTHHGDTCTGVSGSQWRDSKALVIEQIP